MSRLCERGCLGVRSLSARAVTGFVEHGGSRYPCALGRAGRTALKREGDGAAPRGTWRLVRVLYRPDRLRRPRTTLPVRPIRPRDGWCDAPGDPCYNRPVLLPHRSSAEHLWRADALYDLVVVLDHNTRPRRRNGGSAIFMHVARPDLAPTQGCIALARRHLLRLLQRLPRQATIRI